MTDQQQQQFARRSRAGFLWLVLLAAPAAAQVPPGYYSSVDDSTPALLRATLHEVIDDHQRYPYTSGSTDTWDILEVAQIDPGVPGNILDVYANKSHPPQGGGNSLYNREHTWPKSYGFPSESGSYPYTDCHLLFLCDPGMNSSRSNKPFRTCSASCSEEPTVGNNGQGGGSGVYVGNSNWTSGSFTQGTWETWIGRRGDVARALLYADVRYEGGTHGITGLSEPDLILTDVEALIDASNTGQNESVAYMGMLSVLVQWHWEDPPDALDLFRNDAVYSYQGNRNPFVDNPDWVNCLFAGVCGTQPGPPTGLAAFPGDGRIDLAWNANGEPDIAGYRVYRSSTSGGGYNQINPGLVASPAYADTTVVNGTTYFYVVTAENTVGEESGYSNEVNGIPVGGSPQPGFIWINEIHYENSGVDVDERLEVAGPAGTDLSGWTAYAYNGNGGVIYDSIPLSGVIPDQGGCVGTLNFLFPNLQNGAPDALALVDDLNVVIDFPSYEGVVVATEGPAAGMTSVDIGVSQTTSTPVGQSLQLGGTGNHRSDFAWQSVLAQTQGLPNENQLFTGGCSGPVSYCTAGVSASGCQASLSTAGTPSATAASGFALQAAGVEGQKVGLFFFGTNGRQANPWGSSTSLQCVSPPVRRGGVLAASGTASSCDGSYSQDLNALWCPTCPGQAKNPGAGATVQAQLWYRDPQNTSNQTTSLSDAVEFVVGS